MVEKSNYDLLLSKLDRFIRKYYINKIIRGGLITIGLCLAIFLTYTLIEHQFYFSGGIRKVLLFSYLSIFVGSLVYFVLVPLLKYLNLGKAISHEQAAVILGDHFGQMSDKLLNILQLKKESSGTDQLALIEASINQKSEEIKVIPFKNAIDLTRNKKYLRYALPPLMALLFILWAAPSLITDSTYRIINNDTEFEKPAPYHFIIDEGDLEVVQYDDYKLTVNIEGDKLPNEAFITVDNYDYRLTKESPSQFSYLFSNVRKDTPFELYSGKQRSDRKELKILAKPKMLDFSVSLSYPGYTGLKNEIISNAGDFVAPEGTTASWRFDTKSTDQVVIQFDNAEQVSIDKIGSSDFRYKKGIYRDESYKVSLSNVHVPRGDSMTFFIRSVKDQHPLINVETLQDSLESHIHYFAGAVSDDYGLTRLSFVYELVDDSEEVIKTSQVPVPFDLGTQAEYSYILDINEYDLKPGHSMRYYFEVADNDRVHGSKTSRTSIMSSSQEEHQRIKRGRRS